MYSSLFISLWLLVLQNSNISISDHCLKHTGTDYLQKDQMSRSKALLASPASANLVSHLYQNQPPYTTALIYVFFPLIYNFHIEFP